MQKRGFNAYKLKRLFRKKVDTIQHSLDSTFFESSSRKQDFAWRGRHHNPHITRPKSKEQAAKVKILAFIGIAGATFGLISYHSTFKIDQVNLDGLNRIHEGDIRQTIEAALEGNSWLIFPRSNYFFVNIEEIQDILINKYPIASVTISKSFPKTLSVSVQEKISNIIYDNGKQYAYVDLNGNVLEIKRNVLEREWTAHFKEVTSTDEFGNELRKQEIESRKHTPDVVAITKELGNLPILYDARSIDLAQGASIIDPNTAKKTVEWYDALTEKTDIPISYFEIEDEIGNVVIYTKEGWVIKGKLNNTNSQINELRAVLKEKIKRPNVQYIDVRYSGRVYWK